MVTHRNSEYHFVGLLNRLPTLVCMVVSLFLMACDTRDGNLRTAELPSESEGQPANDDGGNVAGNSNTGGLDPVLLSSLQPVAVRLTTLEETSVSSFFTVIGVPDDIDFIEPPYVVVTEPANGTLVHGPGSRLFAYTPARDFNGVDSFEYGIAAGKSATVTIDVSKVNDAPILFADIPRVIEQGSPYFATLAASDPDDESLVFQAGNLPSWLTLNTATGELSGSPSRFDIGIVSNIEFSVTDSSGLSSTVSNVGIEVIASNDAPFINVDQFPSALDAGQAIQVFLFPADPNGDEVSVAFESNDFLDISVSGGTVDVIAAEVDAVKDVNMVLIATDSRGGVARSIVPFRIHPINKTGNGRTMFGRGEKGAGVHLVVLGDGYREDQQTQFRKHVETLVEKMRADVGMRTHFSAWNVHMVETPSVDSGIDDNMAVDIRDTVYNTGYFCKAVRRLICGDQTAIYSVAIDEYPNFDQILVLVNDSRFGGGGNDIAISSTESIEIALHEMGHTIAGLADEYVDQYIPDVSVPSYLEGQFPNVSRNNDAAKVPWSHWLGENETGLQADASLGVGVFEGAYYQADGFYRATEDSLMRSYDGTLGPINSEQWALSVYSRAGAVLDISPVNQLLAIPAGETVEFSVEPTFDSSLQSVEWRLDETIIPDSGSEKPSVSLNFPPGDYEVSVEVNDISGLIRKPAPHNGVFNWQWTVVVR